MTGKRTLKVVTDASNGTAGTIYFLVEDLAPGGVVQLEGGGKIHVINVLGNRLELDTRFASISIAISARGPHARMER
jgi:hypothetical protein